MSEMATVPPGPQQPQQPDTPGARGRSSRRATIAWVVAALVVSAALGLLGGLIWGEVAPRATLQEIAAGTAELIDAETRAFFGADVWFGGIGAVAGLLTGILGYRFAVAPREGGSRAAVAGALIAGAVAGSAVMMWLGEQIGLSAYNHHLASSPDGTIFSSSLTLGAKSILVFWPLLTSAVLLIAEWGARPSPEHPREHEEEPSQDQEQRQDPQ
jgi:hypothetical protein